MKSKEDIPANLARERQGTNPGFHEASESPIRLKKGRFPMSPPLRGQLKLPLTIFFCISPQMLYFTCIELTSRDKKKGNRKIYQNENKTVLATPCPEKSRAKQTCKVQLFLFFMLVPSLWWNIKAQWWIEVVMAGKLVLFSSQGKSFQQFMMKLSFGVGVFL